MGEVCDHDRGNYGRPVRHVARTVTDGECSVAFYTAVLNFPVLAPMGARVLLRNGTMSWRLAQPLTSR